MTKAEQIGLKIRNYRIEKGYSQEELGKLLGYKSRSTINKIEKGLIDLSQSKINTLAFVFDTTPEDLMCWDKEKTTKNDKYNNLFDIDDVVFVHFDGNALGNHEFVVNTEFALKLLDIISTEYDEVKE